MLIFAMLVSSEEDRTKLEQIYIKYKKLMYYIAMDILKDTHESEDVVQNSIIKTAKYIEKIEEVTSVRVGIVSTSPERDDTIIRG